MLGSSTAQSDKLDRPEPLAALEAQDPREALVALEAQEAPAQLEVPEALVDLVALEALEELEVQAVPEGSVPAEPSAVREVPVALVAQVALVLRVRLAHPAE